MNMGCALLLLAVASWYSLAAHNVPLAADAGALLLLSHQGQHVQLSNSFKVVVYMNSSTIIFPKFSFCFFVFCLYLVSNE